MSNKKILDMKVYVRIILLYCIVFNAAANMVYNNG